MQEVAIKSCDSELWIQIANNCLEKLSGFALRKWEVGETEGLLFFVQTLYKSLPVYMHAHSL